MARTSPWEKKKHKKETDPNFIDSLIEKKFSSEGYSQIHK